MESFKGYDLDTLVTRFSSGGAGIELGDVKSVSGYECFPAAAVGDAYTFKIKEMKVDDGAPYDVTITATPNSVEQVMELYDAESTRDAIFNGEKGREYDSQAYGKAVDAARDYVNAHKGDFVSAFSDKAAEQGEDYEDDAYVEIDGQKEIISESNVEKLKLENNIKLDEKRLTFDLSLADSGTNYVVTAKLEYTFHFGEMTYYVKKKENSSTSKDDEYEVEGGSAVAPEHKEEYDSRSLAYLNNENACSYEFLMEDKYTRIYKNPVAAKLDRLYIYYYPNYNIGEDKIIINNHVTSVPIAGFECFILKQRTSQLSDASLKSKENGYKANVKIDNASGESWKVFHNFYDNVGGGSSTAEPSFTGTGYDTYSYTKKESEPDGTKPAFVGEAEKSAVLSYKLELEVTQGGRTITKIESTMNEKIKK